MPIVKTHMMETESSYHQTMGTQWDINEFYWTVGEAETQGGKCPSMEATNLLVL